MHSPTSTQQVRDMFDRIAPTYDLLNFLLSGGAHTWWGKAAVNAAPVNRNGVCLDLCAGTGALVPLLASRYGRVVAADISPGMLALGQKRFQEITNCEWHEADAMALPFDESVFDAVTVAYGVRNLPEPLVGLREMYRVTRPGGTLVVLEFGQPKNPVWRWIFRQYSRYVIPTVGALVSRDRDAYRYLPETSSVFPCGAAFEALMREAGWGVLRTRMLFGGIAYIYVGYK
jgi:demethylmenaquinone methyltransferase/2-methoxy-6-polyprenyl-1,4-benzoquinol methylase